MRTWLGACSTRGTVRRRTRSTRRGKIEAGVATAAALGAGGYAYHEHHEQKEARYEGKDHRVPHGYYCN